MIFQIIDIINLKIQIRLFNKFRFFYKYNLFNESKVKDCNKDFKEIAVAKQFQSLNIIGFANWVLVKFRVGL
jgi:hypothetical protein